MLKGSKTISDTNHFIDSDTGNIVKSGDEANFLNNYFCNIAERLDLNTNADPNLDYFDTIMHNMYGYIDDTFDLCADEIAPGELEYIVTTIDVSKSSCVSGISTSICKDIMKLLPHEMAYLFNCSIRRGIFPSDWSTGTITVIPKPGNLSDPSNWRPITLTPIFEKLVYKRLLSYCNDNTVLSPYQYGFRSGRSTQEAVFDLTKFIYTSLNNKKIISAICLDVCKAFDCINHDILLLKMQKMGFSLNTMSWFRSYLTRKTECQVQ